MNPAFTGLATNGPWTLLYLRAEGWGGLEVHFQLYFPTASVRVVRCNSAEGPDCLEGDLSALFQTQNRMVSFPLQIHTELVLGDLTVIHKCLSVL